MSNQAPPPAFISWYPVVNIPMQALTLNCPSCGAAVSSDAPNCLFCHSRLATVACPACFGLMFLDSRHCSHCGAKAARAEGGTAQTLPCPRCRLALGRVEVGAVTLHDCAGCAGVWLDAGMFRRLCANREQQAAVLGFGIFEARSVPSSKVNYVPCPECKGLMNRTNFARCSGVVVDVCKQHGTWFDRDELRRTIEFIHNGGLDLAREKEKAALVEERRRLNQEQLVTERDAWRTLLTAPKEQPRSFSEWLRRLTGLFTD